MATVTYDTITNSTDLMNYVQGSPNTYMYPDSNTVSIYGPIWLPKVYGKDLTAFEIASSGKIAITINDVHSLDVSNSNYDANSNILTTLNTKSNYALEFMTNSRKLKVVLDSYSNDMRLHAESNIYMTTASKDIELTAGKHYLLNSKSNVDLSAQEGNLQLYANSSNMYMRFTRTTSNIEFYSSSNMTTYVASDIRTVASNNYILSAECNVDVTSQNASINLSANLANQYIKLQDVASNIDIYSSSNMTTYVAKDIRTVASNNYILSAECNVDVTAQNASILLSANLGNQHIKLLDTTSNIDIYSSSNMTTYAAKDIRTVASNNYVLTAECNVDVTAQNASINLSANLGNQYIKLQDVASNIDIYSSSNMTTYVVSDIRTVASNSYFVSAESNIEMTAQNASMLLSANLGNQYIKLLDTTSNIDVYSSSNMTTYVVSDIRTVASNSYFVSAESNIEMTAQNASMLLSANLGNQYIKLLDTTSNIDVYSSSNMTTYVAKDIRAVASNSYFVTAECNIELTAQNASMLLSANLGNQYIKLLDTTSNIDVYSSSNMTTYVAKDIRAVASNSYFVTAECNIEMTAQNASMLLSANLGNQYIKLLDTDSNIDIFSSSNMTTYVAKDIRAVASNSYFVTAECNIEMTAQNASMLLSANLGNQYIKLLDTTSNIDIYSSSNMTTYVAKDIRSVASNNFIVSAECNVDITAQNASVLISANQANQYIKLLDTDSNIDIYSSSNMTTYVAKDIRTVASNDYLLNVDSDIIVNAAHGDTLMYSQSNLFVTSHDSNIYLRLKAPEDTATLYALSNMTFNTSNEMYMYARTNTYVTTSNLFTQIYNDMVTTACNSMYITACNDIRMEALDKIDISATEVNIITRSDISYTALSNLNFYISSTQDNPQDAIFTISGGVVRVRGDMVITGTINTSNIINTTVVQENLKVNDKIILLASVGDGSSNDILPNDGPTTNDESGIEIDGFPSGVNSNEYSMHKKFLKWRYNVEGTKDLGTSNLDTESYWDLQGGSFRITKKKNYGTVQAPNIKDLSFGFRINENDELEIIKKFYHPSTSNYVHKRLSKFGRVL